MSDFVAQTLADPTVTTIGTALGVALVALWLAAAWWTYADATRRTERSLAGYIAAGWVLLSTPLLLPLALAIYGFARPQVAAGDQRVRSLIQELGATPDGKRCSTCGTAVDVAWLRCPTCTTWIASPCSSCARWSDASLELCPWCGGESRERPFVEDSAPATIPVAAAAQVAVTRGAAPNEIDDAQTPPHRRTRLGWRIGSPSVPHSLRGDRRRLGLAPDGRRLSRARTRA